MNLWMLLPVTALIFVILFFLNVVRIIIYKRNCRIQEQTLRKQKLQLQIRVISQVLQRIFKKVKGNEVTKRKQRKSRCHKVRSAILRKRISFRRKRIRVARKKLKHKIDFIAPSPSALPHGVDEKVPSQWNAVDESDTVTNSTEPQERIDVSNQFSEETIDHSSSFRYSDESSSLGCNSSTEVTPRAANNSINICADHQITSANTDDVVGNHIHKETESLTKRFPDINLLDLVRLDGQNQERESSASDGCWSPVKLRSESLTAKSKRSAVFTSAHEISSDCVTGTEAPTSRVQNLVNVVEGLDAEKDAALPQTLQNAHAKMILDMEQVKKAFQLSEEKNKFTIPDVHSCPELQRTRALTGGKTSRMNRMEGQVCQTRKACKKLTPHEPEPKKINKERRFEVALAWEYKHYDRFNETRKNIIARVKSAMEMHWNYAVKENKEKFSKARSDQVLCYECAKGKHKQYVIVSLRDAIDSGDGVFLNKNDGFDESCPVVALVNSWCDKLLENCCTNRDKADKLEDLLRRILKEFYSKRYLERGQLISQVYRTMSAH